MRRSIDRIRTTHVGALQRPPELSKAMAAQGQWAPAVLEQLRAGVSDVVRRQVATGIDIVDDGEFGKTMWSWYVRDRLELLLQLQRYPAGGHRPAPVPAGGGPALSAGAKARRSRETVLRSINGSPA